jgi:hypothetical protein
LNQEDVVKEFTEQPHISMVMVADHAEATNGKLYANGLGITDIQRPVMQGQPLPPTAFSIVLSVFIPWGDTNRTIPLKVTVEDDDGAKLFDATTPLVIGRPAQLITGSGQYAHAAMQVVATFQKAGGYRVVVNLDNDRDVKTWSFRIHDLFQQQKAS